MTARLDRLAAAATLAVALALTAMVLTACSGSETAARPVEARPDRPPPPRGPERIVLVDSPLEFQDQSEPFLLQKTFEFELPRRPRRARLLLRYSGVPGATSEDYTMGRFRDRVELNNAFLMDLNTFARDEQQVVEHTKWISPGMFRRHNRLTFTAGEGGGQAGAPDRDEFTLRSAILELDW